MIGKQFRKQLQSAIPVVSAAHPVPAMFEVSQIAKIGDPHGGIEGAISFCRVSVEPAEKCLSSPSLSQLARRFCRAGLWEKTDQAA